MKIIEAEEQHIPEILELWRELMDFHRELDSYYTMRDGAPETWTAFLRERMESSEDIVIVALDGEKVIGYSIARIKDYPPVFVLKKHGFISEIMVSPDHRNRGIGDRMLARLMDWFDSHGLKRIELRVSSKNEKGTSFWERHGFKAHHHTLYIEK